MGIGECEKIDESVFQIVLEVDFSLSETGKATTRPDESLFNVSSNRPEGFSAIMARDNLES